MLSISQNKIYLQKKKSVKIYRSSNKLTDIQILIYIISYQKVVRRQKVENQLSPMKAHTNLLIHHGKLYLYSSAYTYD